MILNKQFTITYYSNKDSKTITRQATWSEGCKYWTSKVGDSLMTYFDMDAQQFRTAKNSWTVRNK